LFNLLEL